MLDVYRTYYKMTGEPFRLGPDHRFSIAHTSYANAKAYLQYAIFQGEGFIAVTGRAGTGKTTLINDLLEGLDKEHIEAATLTSTQLESRDLLQMVVNLFGLHPEDNSKPGLLQELEQYLNQQSYKGRRVILIVDEAQGLSASALEELRLMANLQRNHQLLLQIFLVGQEQLLEMLRSPGMEHLQQRLIAASHLQPLELDELIDYVEHRLSRVGWKGDPSIDEGALRVIYQYSGGIPRRINLICNRLFLYGGLEQKHALNTKDARLVVEELKKEFLLPAESADDENRPDVVAEPDKGADAPVRSLPRRDMNAAPAPPPADKPAASPEAPDTPRQPEKAKPAAEKPRKKARPAGKKKKSPEQITPAQVAGRKRRIEPTMRREPTIGPSGPVPASEPPAKKRSWGKVAAVAVIAGFAWGIYNGDREFDLLGLFSTENEAKPQVAFNAPLETTVTFEEPVKVEEPEPASSDAITDQADTGGEESPAGAEVPTSSPESATDAPPPPPVVEALTDVKSENVPPVPAPVEPVTTKSEVVVSEPRNTKEIDPNVKVASAKPEKSSGVVQREPVKVETVDIEAEKARLQREAELRLAMNLNQNGSSRKTAVPKKKLAPPPSKPEVPVKKAAAPVKKLVSPPPPKPEVPVKVATAAKIKTAPKRSPLELLKAALLEGQWASRGKPASLLPSKVTYCNSQGERIACQSVPQDIKTKYGPALYKVETTLKGFSAEKSFQLSYRTLVKLLENDTDSAREEALSVNSGWQISEYSMSCRLTRPDQVSCRDEKGVTRDYRRSIPATIN